jgi:hypothetical protein
LHSFQWQKNYSKDTGILLLLDETENNIRCRRIEEIATEQGKGLATPEKMWQSVGPQA